MYADVLCLRCTYVHKTQLNYDHSLGWPFLFLHSYASGGFEREVWRVAPVSHLERKQQPLVSCAQATRM